MFPMLNSYAVLKFFLNDGFYGGNFLKFSGSGNRKTRHSGKISGQGDRFKICPPPPSAMRVSARQLRRLVSTATHTTSKLETQWKGHEGLQNTDNTKKGGGNPSGTNSKIPPNTGKIQTVGNTMVQKRIQGASTRGESAEVLRSGTKVRYETDPHQRSQKRRLEGTFTV